MALQFNTVFGMRVVYVRSSLGLNVPQRTLQLVLNPTPVVQLELPKNPRVIGRETLDVCEIDDGLYAWLEPRPQVVPERYCLFLLATGLQASEAFGRVHGSCTCGMHSVIETARTLQATREDPAEDAQVLKGGARCDLTAIYENVKAAHTLQLAAERGLPATLDVQQTVFYKEYAVR